jgi:hypothetical protein
MIAVSLPSNPIVPRFPVICLIVFSGIFVKGKLKIPGANPSSDHIGPKDGKVQIQLGNSQGD